LTDVFAWKEERTLSNNLTVQYDKILFMLEPNEITRPLARQRVTVATIRTAGSQYGTRAATYRTAPSTSCIKSTSRQLSRTSV